MLCSCGRAEASPYGIRALGQWLECCDLCAAEFDEGRRDDALSGSNRYDLWPGSPSAADTVCAWCGRGRDLIGEVVNGGRWWICRACFVSRTGVQPWDSAAHMPRFRADLTELRKRYARLMGTSTPDPLPIEAPFGGDVLNAFLFHDHAPLAVDELAGTGLAAHYRSSSSPAWVVERWDRTVRDGFPGFTFAEAPLGETGIGGSWDWYLGHDGRLRWFGEGKRPPGPSPLLAEWLRGERDPLVDLVAREAAVILTAWEPGGELAPEIMGTPLQHWQLRLTLARIAAVEFTGAHRERALDALCGLGWYGDERASLIPTPESMGVVKWPVHPVLPVPPEVARSTPIAR